MSVRGDHHGDATFGGICGFAEQQGGERRLLHGGDHPVGELLGQAQLLGGESKCLVGLAQLDKTDHRVQTVRGLVGLRPQGLGQPTRRIQFSGQGFQIRAVAQGRHVADAPTVPFGRGLVHHEYALGGDELLVATTLLIDQRGDQRPG